MNRYALLKDSINDSIFGVIVDSNGLSKFYGVSAKGLEWSKWANGINVKSENNGLPIGVVVGGYSALRNTSPNYVQALVDTVSLRNPSINKKQGISDSLIKNSSSVVPGVRDAELRAFDIDKRNEAIAFKARAFRTDSKVSSLLTQVRAERLGFVSAEGVFSSRNPIHTPEVKQAEIIDSYGRSLQRAIGLSLIRKKSVKMLAVVRKDQALAKSFGLEVKAASIGPKIGSRLSGGLRAAPAGMSFVDITGVTDADTDGIVFEGKPGLERPIIPRFMVPKDLARKLSGIVEGDAEVVEKQRRAGNTSVQFDEGKLRNIIASVGGDANMLTALTGENGIPVTTPSGRERLSVSAPSPTGIARDVARDAVIGSRVRSGQRSDLGDATPLSSGELKKLSQQELVDRLIEDRNAGLNLEEAAKKYGLKGGRAEARRLEAREMSRRDSGMRSRFSRYDDSADGQWEADAPTQASLDREDYENYIDTPTFEEHLNDWLVDNPGKTREDFINDPDGAELAWDSYMENDDPKKYYGISDAEWAAGMRSRSGDDYEREDMTPWGNGKWSSQSPDDLIDNWDDLSDESKDRRMEFFYDQMRDELPAEGDYEGLEKFLTRVEDKARTQFEDEVGIPSSGGMRSRSGDEPLTDEQVTNIKKRLIALESAVESGDKEAQKELLKKIFKGKFYLEPFIGEQFGKQVLYQRPKTLGRDGNSSDAPDKEITDEDLAHFIKNKYEDDAYNQIWGALSHNGDDVDDEEGLSSEQIEEALPYIDLYDTAMEILEEENEGSYDTPSTIEEIADIVGSEELLSLELWKQINLRKEKLKRNEERGMRSRYDGGKWDGRRPEPEDIKPGADLSGAQLSGMDLEGRDLTGVNLYQANLLGAKLSNVNLSGANLHGARIAKTNLKYANLTGADLRDTKLYGADLRYAKLSGADLLRADLRQADLRDADLRDADLTDANLEGANLKGAILDKGWEQKVGMRSRSGGMRSQMNTSGAPKEYADAIEPLSVYFGYIKENPYKGYPNHPAWASINWSDENKGWELSFDSGDGVDLLITSDDPKAAAEAIDYILDATNQRFDSDAYRGSEYDGEYQNISDFGTSSFVDDFNSGAFDGVKITLLNDRGMRSRSGMRSRTEPLFEVERLDSYLSDHQQSRLHEAAFKNPRINLDDGNIPDDHLIELTGMNFYNPEVNDDLADDIEDLMVERDNKRLDAQGRSTGIAKDNARSVIKHWQDSVDDDPDKMEDLLSSYEGDLVAAMEDHYDDYLNGQLDTFENRRDGGMRSRFDPTPFMNRKPLSVWRNGKYNASVRSNQGIPPQKEIKPQSDLTGANLRDMDLSGRDLSGSMLVGAIADRVNLTDANLSATNLWKVKITAGKMSGADLNGSSIDNASLIETDFTNANLSNTSLRNTNLVKAKLINANLQGADLRGADLSRADLSGANLEGADLGGANLEGAKMPDGWKPSGGMRSRSGYTSGVSYIVDDYLDDPQSDRDFAEWQKDNPGKTKKDFIDDVENIVEEMFTEQYNPDSPIYIEDVMDRVEARRLENRRDGGMRSRSIKLRSDVAEAEEDIENEFDKWEKNLKKRYKNGRQAEYGLQELLLDLDRAANESATNEDDHERLNDFIDSIAKFVRRDIEDLLGSRFSDDNDDDDEEFDDDDYDYDALASGERQGMRSRSGGDDSDEGIQDDYVNSDRYWQDYEDWMRASPQPRTVNEWERQGMPSRSGGMRSSTELRGRDFKRDANIRANHLGKDAETWPRTARLQDVIYPERPYWGAEDVRRSDKIILSSPSENGGPEGKVYIAEFDDETGTLTVSWGRADSRNLQTKVYSGKTEEDFRKLLRGKEQRGYRLEGGHIPAKYSSYDKDVDWKADHEKQAKMGMRSSTATEQRPYFNVSVTGSSALRQASYDAEKEELVVTYANGKTYTYKNFSNDDLDNALSGPDYVLTGTAVNQIKKNHDFREGGVHTFDPEYQDIQGPGGQIGTGKLSRLGRREKTQIPVSGSSAIEALTWDDDKKDLIVTYAGGRTYTYKDVDSYWIEDLERETGTGRIINNIKKEGYRVVDGGEHGDMPSEGLTAERANFGMRSRMAPSSGRIRAAEMEISARPQGMASRRSEGLRDPRFAVPGRDRVDPSDGELWGRLSDEEKTTVADRAVNREKMLLNEFKQRFPRWWDRASKEADKKGWDKDLMNGGNAGWMDELHRFVTRLADDPDYPEKNRVEAEKQFNDLQALYNMRSNRGSHDLLEHLNPTSRRYLFDDARRDDSKKTRISASGKEMKTPSTAPRPLGDPIDTGTPIREQVGQNEKKPLKARLDAYYKRMSDKILYTDPARQARREMRKARRQGINAGGFTTSEANPVDDAKRKIRRRKRLKEMRKNRTRDIGSISDSSTGNRIDGRLAHTDSQGSLVFGDKLTSTLATMMKNYRTESKLKKTKGGVSRNRALAVLWDGAGYNGTPHVVTPEEFKALHAGGWVPVVRGHGSGANGVRYANDWIDDPVRFITGQGGEAQGEGEYWARPTQGGGGWFSWMDGSLPAGTVGLLPPSTRRVSKAELGKIKSEHAPLAKSIKAFDAGLPSGEREKMDAEEYVTQLRDHLRTSLGPVYESTMSTKMGQMTSKILESLSGSSDSKKQELLDALEFLELISTKRTSNSYAPLLGYDTIMADSGVELIHNRTAITIVGDTLTRDDAVKLAKSKA